MEVRAEAQAATVADGVVHDAGYDFEIVKPVTQRYGLPL
jgi:hypothetical protein